MPKHDSTPIDTWRASCLASIKLPHRLENEANKDAEKINPMYQPGPHQIVADH